MKKSLTIFLQIVTILFGVGVLVVLLWEPRLEGVNTHATTLSEIYFDDPFLAYVYLGSIPCLIGLYKTFKILGYIRNNKVFSQATIKALQTIKYCALITAGAIIGADIFLALAKHSGEDDPAGAIMLGIITTFISIAIAAATIAFEKLLQNVVNIKSENDLTI